MRFHRLRAQAASDWAHVQVYLNPYPKKLLLRNRV
jgi:hypothetical protein